MRRDEDWFDAVGKDDWRVEQIEKREKEKKTMRNRGTMVEMYVNDVQKEAIRDARPEVN